MPRRKLSQRAELPQPRTLEQWAKDEEGRERLVQLLQDPIMVEAMATLDAAYTPAVPGVVSSNAGNGIAPAADLNNTLALRHVHRAGFFGYINALRNLTRAKVLRRAERAPWGDFIPED